MIRLFFTFKFSDIIYDRTSALGRYFFEVVENDVSSNVVGDVVWVSSRPEHG
jgi:hypothetical protein